jgi:hypothetical protein
LDLLLLASASLFHFALLFTFPSDDWCVSTLPTKGLVPRVTMLISH